jgi:hypothetical protein
LRAIESVAAQNRDGSGCSRCFGDNGARTGSRVGVQVREFVALNIVREAEGSQSPNAIPVHVNLIPSQAVTGGLRNSVMVVVPAFAESQQGDPKTVLGSVVREEPA